MIPLGNTWGHGAATSGQAQQPHHLFCCPADTGTALLFHDQLPVGWGGVINNVHVPVPTQAQQPHHLSSCPADTGTTLLFHDQLPVGCGGVGWGNNVHVPVHTQARRSCYVVTSSSSDLQDVPDTLSYLLQVTCKMCLLRCKSSSSNLPDVPDTLEHLLQVTCKTFLIHPDTFKTVLQVTCQLFLIRCNIFFK